jgi:lantibiotic modifying enzyme
MQSKTPWRSILSANYVQRATAVVHQIAKVFLELFPETGDSIGPSLALGKAGIAVFLAYYSASAIGNVEAGEGAVRYLNAAVEEVAALQPRLGFLEGVCGVAWATHHVASVLDIALESDATADVDVAILEMLNDRTNWVHDFDLIHGLVGIGVYALERSAEPRGRLMLELITRHLANAAERTSSGIAWETLSSPSLDSAFGAARVPYFDLGIPTGELGVIAFLASLLQKGIASELTSALLAQAVQWTLAQKRASGTVSCYPFAAGEHESSRHPFIGWCYGDAGVAAVLYRASQCAQNKDWELEALRVAKFAARVSPHSAKYFDACLCHGSSGIAHLFNRLFQQTGDIVFARAARRWYRIALTSRSGENGIAGYEFNWLGRTAGYPGLLRGAAGLGLSLLAASTPQSPDWDRMLLLSGHANH